MSHINFVISQWALQLAKMADHMKYFGRPLPGGEYSAPPLADDIDSFVKALQNVIEKILETRTISLRVGQWKTETEEVLEHLPTACKTDPRSVAGAVIRAFTFDEDGGKAAELMGRAKVSRFVAITKSRNLRDVLNFYRASRDYGHRDVKVDVITGLVDSLVNKSACVIYRDLFKQFPYAFSLVCIFSPYATIRTTLAPLESGVISIDVFMKCVYMPPEGSNISPKMILSSLVNYYNPEDNDSKRVLWALMKQFNDTGRLPGDARSLLQRARRLQKSISMDDITSERQKIFALLPDEQEDDFDTPFWRLGEEPETMTDAEVAEIMAGLGEEESDPNQDLDDRDISIITGFVDKLGLE